MGGQTSQGRCHLVSRLAPGPAAAAPRQAVRSYTRTLTRTGRAASRRLRAGPGDVCASPRGAGGAGPGQAGGGATLPARMGSSSAWQGLGGSQGSPGVPPPRRGRLEPRLPPHPHCWFSSGRRRQRSFVAAKRAGAIVLEGLQEGTVGDGVRKKVEEKRGKSCEGRRNLLLLSPVPPFLGRAEVQAAVLGGPPAAPCPPGPG